MSETLVEPEKKKNRYAVAMGRKGGHAGKGSEKRRAAAIKANAARWANRVPENNSK